MSEKTTNAVPSTSLEGRRASLLREIRDHNAYYERWRTVNAVLWHATQFFIIISGAVASVAAVYSNLEYSKVVATVVPILASLAATLQLQFRFRDTWRLREEGRIKLQGLRIELEQTPLSDAAAAEKCLADITKRLNALSETQGSAFFTLIEKPGDDKAGK